MSKYHFISKNGFILCDDGHGGYTKIAKVLIERQCTALINHVHLAEDVEVLTDNLLANEYKGYKDD